MGYLRPVERHIGGRVCSPTRTHCPNATSACPAQGGGHVASPLCPLPSWAWPDVPGCTSSQRIDSRCSLHMSAADRRGNGVQERPFTQQRCVGGTVSFLLALVCG